MMVIGYSSWFLDLCVLPMGDTVPYKVDQDEITSWGTTTQLCSISIPNWCLSCIFKQPLLPSIRPAAFGYEIDEGIPWSRLIPCQWI